VLSLRVGLVSSIYSLVCASSLVILHFRPHVLRFCVLVLIVPSPHRFIVFLRLNPLRLPVCCCLAHPWACILTNNIPLSRILIVVPRIPLMDSTQTNQPTRVPSPSRDVSLFCPFLHSSPLIFFFFGCCYFYHCLSPVVQYSITISLFSLSIVLVLICFNSVTLCLSPNLYNCMMQMVFRPIGLASQLSMRRIFEQRQSDDSWGDWKRAIITPTGRSDGIELTDNCKHNPQDKLADAVSSWPFSKNMWKCIFT